MNEIVDRIQKSGETDFNKAGRTVCQGLFTDLENSGYKSLVSTPMIAKGKLLGCINIAAKSRRNMTEEELNLLEILGSQVGVAIENARLYEELCKKQA